MEIFSVKEHVFHRICVHQVKLLKTKLKLQQNAATKIFVLVINTFFLLKILVQNQQMFIFFTFISFLFSFLNILFVFKSKFLINYCF